MRPGVFSISHSQGNAPQRLCDSDDNDGEEEEDDEDDDR